MNDKPKRYISIDLELEQSSTNVQCPDSAITEERIIQVGAVVFELTKETEPLILKTECINIYYPYRLSNFISKLCNIKSDDLLNSEETVLTAVKRLCDLRTEFDTSRILVQWGGGDDVALNKESAGGLHSFGRSAYNAKHLYQLYKTANNKPTSGGLKAALKALNMQFVPVVIGKRQYGAHNAAADALNTARIFNALINKISHREQVCVNPVSPQE